MRDAIIGAVVILTLLVSIAVVAKGINAGCYVSSLAVEQPSDFDQSR